jgi:hypothetical protein
MVKKDFKAGLSASVKAQDAANIKRFETAGSVLANLTAALGKPHQAAPSTSESDSALLETLQKAAALEGSLLTASDICRIGIHAISGYRGKDVIAAAGKLEQLRPGRKY